MGAGRGVLGEYVGAGRGVLAEYVGAGRGVLGEYVGAGRGVLGEEANREPQAGRLTALVQVPTPQGNEPGC